MKKTLITFLICLGVLFTYVFFINFIATGPFNNLLDFDNNSEDISGAMLDMSVLDNVEVTVIRNRWYGQIIENTNQDVSKNTNDLYLFKVVKLPIEIGGINLTLIHSVVAMLLFLSIVIASMFDLAGKIERRYDKK